MRKLKIKIRFTIQWIIVPIWKNFVERFESIHSEIILFLFYCNLARKKIETLIPLVRSDADVRLFKSFPPKDENFTSLAVNTIYSMFVRFGDVHVIRGVEPALKLRYRETDCTPFLSIADKTIAALYKHCLTTRNSNLGSRGQLSRLLLDYQESNAINLLSWRTHLSHSHFSMLWFRIRTFINSISLRVAWVSPMFHFVLQSRRHLDIIRALRDNNNCFTNSLAIRKSNQRRVNISAYGIKSNVGETKRYFLFLFL